MLSRNVLFELRGASAAAFKRPVAIIGFIVAVAGPWLLLTTGGRDPNRLPWYIWTIVPLLLLSVIGGGFFLFNRKDHSGDMSISPKNRQGDGD
jgi:hypothetical protein